jgi:membrane protein
MNIDPGKGCLHVTGKDYWDVLKTTIGKCDDDNIQKMGASLSYFTVFSLAPFLIIVIAVAGFIFGADAAQGRIFSEFDSLVGKESALLIQTAIRQSADKGTGILAAAISGILLVIGSITVFVELQDSLNIIWKVKPKPKGTALRQFLKVRLLSFALIIAIGFLLLISLVVSAVLTAIGLYFNSLVTIPVYLLEILNNLLSILIISALFATIFKILPDVELDWKDVRIASFVTAILFVIGKYLIGLYIGSSSFGSTYGAAGSLVIILVWVFYSSQILFLGAELTFVYAEKRGSMIMPSDFAVKATLETVEHGKVSTTVISTKRVRE